MYEKEKYKPKKEGAMKKMRRVKDLFMNTTKMKPTTKITNSRSNLPRL